MNTLSSITKPNQSDLASAITDVLAQQQTINNRGNFSPKARYHQAVGSMVYIPQENREICMDDFIDKTIISIGFMFIEGKDLAGEEVAVVNVQNGLLLLRNKESHHDLPIVPIENFNFSCEGSLEDFDERDCLGIDDQVLRLTFKSEDIANAFTQLALTDGGAHFALRFPTGHIEVIILEAEHG